MYNILKEGAVFLDNLSLYFGITLKILIVMTMGIDESFQQVPISMLKQ